MYFKESIRRYLRMLFISDHSDFPLKYFASSPSKLWFSEGGVQPWIVTLGATMQLVLTLSGERGSSSAREGMEPRVTLFLKGFLPFFNTRRLSRRSQSGLAGTLAWWGSPASMDFCLLRGGGGTGPGPPLTQCRPAEMELYICCGLIT